MRRTRAADPKNKKGDKRERGGGGKERKRRKKEGERAFLGLAHGFLVQYVILATKKKFPPRADASGAGKNAPLGHSPFCI